MLGKPGIVLIGGNVNVGRNFPFKRIRFGGIKMPNATITAASIVNIRLYHSSKVNNSMENEKRKYYNLIREQLVTNSIDDNPELRNHHTTGKNGRLSFKTILILIAASSTMSMAVYTISEMTKFYKDESKDRGTIFLPLWINFNMLFQSTYPFPKGLRYFDEEYAVYMEEEMRQLNTSKEKSDIANYTERMEQENIKYTLLEEISKNSTVRQIFGLPLSFKITEKSHFEVWIESRHPAISGIQIDMLRHRNENDTPNSFKTNIKLNWAIKPINITSLIDSALVQAGLKLDRLKASDAQFKTHEKGSGRVHEVPLTDNHKRNDLILNNSKDYNIFFSGNMMIQDKNKFESGKVFYKGLIDFDHLLINRGVKLKDIEIIMKRSDNPNEVIKYKIK